MRCPVCPDMDLAIADRQGIEIDYCPKCRGIWLDRGELDKIIERSSTYAESAPESGKKSRKKKSSRQEGLFKQVKKCIYLLLENPRHPGLNTHEYKPLPNPYNEREKVFEAYAQQKTSAADGVF